MRFLLAAAIVTSLACIALPVVLIVGDALRKLWLDFRAPAKAERIVTESDVDRQQRLASQPFASHLDVEVCEYRQHAWEKHVAEALVQAERASGLAPVAPVVPMQRRGGQS